MLNVQLSIRGVSSADENRLTEIVDALERRGADGVAVVHYPEDEEIGIMFDIEEDALGRVLQPEGSRAAA